MIFIHFHVQLELVSFPYYSYLKKDCPAVVGSRLLSLFSLLTCIKERQVQSITVFADPKMNGFWSTVHLIFWKQNQDNQNETAPPRNSTTFLPPKHTHPKNQPLCIHLLLDSDKSQPIAILDSSSLNCPCPKPHRASSDWTLESIPYFYNISSCTGHPPNLPLSFRLLGAMLSLQWCSCIPWEKFSNSSCHLDENFKAPLCYKKQTLEVLIYSMLSEENFYRVRKKETCHMCMY